MRLVFFFLALVALAFSIYSFTADFTAHIFIGIVAFGLFLIGGFKGVL